MAEATKQLIKEHQAKWLSHCPCQFGKYSFYRALYLALSNAGLRTLPDLSLALRYGNIATKAKAIVLGINLLLP